MKNIAPIPTLNQSTAAPMPTNSPDFENQKPWWYPPGLFIVSFKSGCLLSDSIFINNIWGGSVNGKSNNQKTKGLRVTT